MSIAGLRAIPRGVRVATRFLHGQPEKRVGKEIERKYLVDVTAWKPRDQGVRYQQGYLNAQ
jgi:hypothetical protein